MAVYPEHALQELEKEVKAHVNDIERYTDVQR